MNPDVKQTASGSKAFFFNPHSIPLAESRNLDADPRLYSQASSINSSGSDQRPELHWPYPVRVWTWSMIRKKNMFLESHSQGSCLRHHLR